MQECPRFATKSVEHGPVRADSDGDGGDVANGATCGWCPFVAIASLVGVVATPAPVSDRSDAVAEMGAADSGAANNVGWNADGYAYKQIRCYHQRPDSQTLSKIYPNNLKVITFTVRFRKAA